jgi:peptidoglycan/xylan/chitin deacetylase (PgdA/CDA1 family)
VALTFDDGPGSLSPLAIRILQRAHARATFFLVGRNLSSWPTLPPEELRLGALGDHTWTHPDLRTLSERQMSSELSRTQSAIARLVGEPVRLFRPPYEAHSKAIDAEARKLGMLEVLWSIDTQDSEGAVTRQIGDTVANDVQPGSVILMHDNRGQTTAALRYRILPTLRRLGLRTVSVPELVATDPPTTAQLRAGLAGCAKSA